MLSRPSPKIYKGESAKCKISVSNRDRGLRLLQDWRTKRRVGLLFFPPPVIWGDGRVSNENGQGAKSQMSGLETIRNGQSSDGSIKPGSRYSFIHRHNLTASHSLDEGGMLLYKHVVIVMKTAHLNERKTKSVWYPAL